MKPIVRILFRIDKYILRQVWRDGQVHDMYCQDGGIIKNDRYYFDHIQTLNHFNPELCKILYK
jgi:hypothetical protein